MLIVDNGKGCINFEAFARLGSRFNNRREEDPNEAQLSVFSDFFEARISRYGVGSYHGQNKLGDEFHTRSKQAGKNLVMRVVRSKACGWSTQCSYEAGKMAQSLSTEIQSFSEGLDSGTEIKVLKLDNDFTDLLAMEESREMLCKNMKAIYFNYVEALPQNEEGPGYRRFVSTMRQCMNNGVVKRAKRGRRSQESKYIHEMQDLLWSALTKTQNVNEQVAQSTDIRVTFRSDGTETNFQLAKLRCFIDDICEKAKDCFPLHFPIRGQNTVVMGGVFYFPFKDGSETCPVYDKFLEQTNSHNLLVFWEGRLLPSAADTLQPTFLKGLGKHEVPERVRKRCFTFIFLDSRFQPDYNKRHLAQTGVLDVLFQDQKLAEAYEWWQKRAHVEHDHETMFGHSLSGQEDEEGVYKDTADFRGTTYTKITLHDVEFKRGDCVKILHKSDKKVVAEGKIDCFYHEGTKREASYFGSTGKVEICKFAGNGEFKQEKNPFTLESYDLQKMNREEEKNAHKEASRSIVTQARVLFSPQFQARRPPQLIVVAGQEISATLFLFNSEDERVENVVGAVSARDAAQHLALELLITNETGVVHNKHNFIRDATLRASVKLEKSGKYMFKVQSTGKIQFKDQDGSELPREGISVHILPGHPYALQRINLTTPLQIGVEIPPFEIRVYDRFENGASKDDLDKIQWKLSVDDQSFSITYQIIVGINSISVTKLLVTGACLQGSQTKVFKVCLGGSGKLGNNDILIGPTTFPLEVTHGRPCSLTIGPGLTRTIKCDSALPKISVSLLDGSNNPCKTTTGTLIALSDILSYKESESVMESDTDEMCLLCQLPVEDGKITFGGRQSNPVQGTIFKDPFSRKATENPADLSPRLNLHSRQQAKAHLIEGKDQTILLHLTLGVFQMGDFVMCDIADRSSVQHSRIVNPVMTVARIDRFETKSRSSAHGGSRAHTANNEYVSMEVTVFERAYEIGEEVNAWWSAGGYDTEWWPATIESLDCDGTYNVKWLHEVEDENGALKPQTDVKKRAHDLRKKSTDDHHYVKASKDRLVLDAKQIQSRAFVFHSSVLRRGRASGSPSASSRSTGESEIPVQVFAHNVFFCDCDNMSKVIQTHIDLLFTAKRINESDAGKKWAEYIEGDLVHHRLGFHLVSSEKPKYMELFLRDGSVENLWQVSKCHYNRSSVTSTKLYPRDHVFKTLLKFRDESGTFCNPDMVYPRCSWVVKSEGESPSILGIDGSLPPLEIRISKTVEVEADIIGGGGWRRTLKLAHDVEIQHGDPAKLSVKVLQELRQATNTVKVGQAQNCSLSITVRDAFDEPIRISDQHDLKLAEVYTQDSSGAKHPVTARIEDHGRGEQRWIDVKQGSGHTLERDGNVFILPKCCFGGKVGQAQLIIKAHVLDSTSGERQPIEVRSDEFRLDFKPGPASKIQLIHNNFADHRLSTIYLNSHVSETNTIKVAATDDYGNRVDDQHLSFTLSLPNGTTVESQPEPDQKLYGFTFTAGPYPSGEYPLDVSGRSKVRLEPLQVKVKVKKCNCVKKIELRRVEMSKSQDDQFLTVQAEFHTEDENVLPECCSAECQLLWAANGETLDIIPISNCRDVGWNHGRILKLRVPLSILPARNRKPALYKLCVKYTEKRSGLKDETIHSNSSDVKLLPGLWSLIV